MAKKKSENKIKKKWIIWLILGGIFYLFKDLVRAGKKAKKIEQEIKEYTKEEKREINELMDHKESWSKFSSDSKKLLKDYFIPHSGNCHKPKFLHPKSLMTIALIVLLIKAATVGFLFLSYPQGARVSSQIVSRVLELVNADRIKAGFGALAVNQALTASALAKADNLIANDYFAHTCPDGRKPWDWIDRGQYQYLFVGENLAMNFTTADSVHIALMNSPSHKQNILNDRYNDVGIAMVSGQINGQQTNVLVQHFAARNNPHAAIAAIKDSSAGTTKETVLPPLPGVEQEKTEPAPAVDANEPAVKQKIAALEKEALPLPPLPPAIAEVPQASDLLPAVNLISQNLSGSREENIAPEMISDMEQINLAAANISPNEALEKNLVTRVLSVANPVNEKLVLTSKRVKYINYIFLSILTLVITVLIINII
ncbi:MAG: hypothetical protein KAJ48_05195, partial [Elusimicrobiales bacterium]|nr:hypothetical protein [Elusimicrobiales bacterium]